MTLTTERLIPANFAAWSNLFVASNSSCFCQYWHFTGDKNAWLARCAFESDTNRQLAEQALEEANFSGLLAFDDGKCIGWLKLSPAQHLVKLRNQSVYRKLELESEDVLIIGCILIHPSHRLRGVAVALVRAALVEAKRLGARAVEAYPHAIARGVHDEQAFMGRVSMYEACGFARAAGDDVYPVYRHTLRP